METKNYTPPLTNEDLASISEEARIFLGKEYFSQHVIDRVNDVLEIKQPSSAEISATVRSELDDIYPPFNFSLT